MENTAMKFNNMFLTMALIFISISTYSQLKTSVDRNDLKPYKIEGRSNPLDRNLSFSEYKTAKIRRNIDNMFPLRISDPLNHILLIESVPLRRTDKYKNKDYFKFDLKNEEGLILSVDCTAFLKVNERFRLLKKQDSLFMGQGNMDCLAATINFNNDKLSQWNLAATNLNATKGAIEKGTIISHNEQIDFEVTNLLLNEISNHTQSNQTFTFLNMVYAFIYKNEIVGAVSVKETGRKFWINELLNKEIRDVIAASAVILTLRRNLYQ